MSDIETQVRKVVAEQLGIDATKVHEGASFTKDLGADSLDQVELVMALEEQFEVEIPDETAEKLVTVGDAVNYIQDLQKKGA